MWPMSDPANREYVERLTARFATGEPVPNRQICPECDGVFDRVDCPDAPYGVDSSGHVWTNNGHMVIGCEGYWMFNPATVGIASPNWQALNTE